MKFLLIDENSGTSEIRNYTLLQLTRAIDRMGHDVQYLTVGDLKVPEAIETIKRAEPDIIMSTTLNMVWMSEAMATLPQVKVNLWWDEPIMRIVGLNIVNQVGVMTAKNNFIHFVGDRSWKTRMKSLYKEHAIHLLHLSADHQQFYPAETKLSDDIVFIGTIQSPYGLEQEIERLSPVEKRFVQFAKDEMVHAVKHNLKMPNLNKLQQDINLRWHPGDRTLWLHWQDGRPESLMRTFLIVWTLAKNAHRIRMLKKALKVAPVRIFAEMKQKGHASMYEIRGLLDCWDKSRLLIVDTSGLGADYLGDIYHYGRLHLDICDPQNERDGLAYRLFQTAFSGRPLLVDDTYGVWSCFSQYRDMIPQGGNVAAFEAILDNSYHAKDLYEIGQSALNKALGEHRWEHRIYRILGKCGLIKEEPRFQHSGFENRFFHKEEWIEDFNHLAESCKVELSDLAVKSTNQTPAGDSNGIKHPFIHGNQKI